MSKMIDEMTCEDAMEKLSDLIVRLNDLLGMVEMEITKAEHEIDEDDKIFYTLKPDEMYQANIRATRNIARRRALKGIEYYLSKIIAEYAPQDEDKED